MLLTLSQPVPVLDYRGTADKTQSCRGVVWITTESPSVLLTVLLSLTVSLSLSSCPNTVAVNSQCLLLLSTSPRPSQARGITIYPFSKSHCPICLPVASLSALSSLSLSPLPSSCSGRITISPFSTDQLFLMTVSSEEGQWTSFVPLTLVHFSSLRERESLHHVLIFGQHHTEAHLI